MTLRIDENSAIVLPPEICRTARLAPGDTVEVSASGGLITISNHTEYADGDYTPEQRKALDERFAEAQKGPFYGPFANGDEVAVFLKAWKAKEKRRKAK